MNKKIIVSVFAVAFAFSMVGSAGAVTLEELETLYADLLAKYQLLLNEAAQPTTTTGLCLSGELSLGMTSTAVKTLQQGLNQDPVTQVAVSGAGAPGYETSYFGGLTKAAVIKFQEKYASEVLQSWGFTKGTGYAGQTTIAKFNALYCTPVVVPTTTTLPGETTTTTVVASGEEGYFTYKLLASPSNATSVKKGDVDKTVMSFTLKANNSAISVDRVKLNFDKRPWTYLSEVSFYEGSTLVKEVAAVSSAFEEITVGSDYNLHLTGLGISIAKGETKTFTFKIDVPTSPQNTGTVTLDLVANAIRGVDGAALNVYAPSSANSSRTFVSATATTGALVLSINSGATKDGVAFISDTETTEHVTLATFDLKAKYRDVHITAINNVTTNVGTLAGGIADCLPAIELWDGDTMLGSVTGAADADFTDLDINISKDATKTLTIKASVAIEDAGSAYITPGDNVYVTLAALAASITSEDDLYNSLTDSEISGGLTGKSVYFYVEAPVLSLVSSGLALDADQTDDATGSIVFTVKAEGGDIYFYDDATTTKAITVAEVGGSTATATNSYSVTGYESTDNIVYKVAQGTTATFTITGHLDNDAGTPGFSSFDLTHFKWDETSATPSAEVWTWGLETFKTADVYLSS